MQEESTIEKAFGLPEGIDPNHEYVFRSGEHGIYDFWYRDAFDNYWKYTNAPKDHPDYDKYSGEAIIVEDQPMPHTAPQFYSEEGRKMHIAIPQGMQKVVNEAYDPLNPRSIWYAMYQSEDGEPRYVYYDSDVKENLDLWIQYMLRTTDANLVAYRKYASKLFQSPHPKDQVIGAMLMLADQGFFEAWELVNANVADVEFTDYTIKLMGRKIVCDPDLVEFFSKMSANKEPTDPLFTLNTVHGNNRVGLRHFYSVFKALKVSPHFLLYWHATHLFSRIMHRLAAENVPVEEVEERALSELGRALNLGEDPSFLIDFKTKETLMTNYMPSEEANSEPNVLGELAPNEISKALVRVSGDDLGVATIWSDLTVRRPDEQDFSTWLHATPLHDTSPEEQAAVEEQLSMQQQSDEEPDQPKENDEGAVAEDAGGTSPAPGEGNLPSGGDEDNAP